MITWYDLGTTRVFLCFGIFLIVRSKWGVHLPCRLDVFGSQLSFTLASFFEAAPESPVIEKSWSSEGSDYVFRVRKQKDLAVRPVG